MIDSTHARYRAYRLLIVGLLKADVAFEQKSQIITKMSRTEEELHLTITKKVLFMNSPTLQ